VVDVGDHDFVGFKKLDPFGLRFLISLFKMMWKLWF